MPDELDQRLLDITPDAVLVGVGERVTFANRAAAELFGASSPEELIGRHATSFVPEAARSSVSDRLARYDRGFRTWNATSAIFENTTLA